MSEGMMEEGPKVNGRKLLIAVILGLVAFTLVSMAVTFGVGRFWGNINSKKAMEHEREIDAQKLRDHEAAHTR